MRTKIILVLVLALMLSLGASMTMAMPLSWECLATGSCHLLMYNQSETYVLCADGVLSLEKNGVDSWKLVCGTRYMAVAPIVYKGG